MNEPAQVWRNMMYQLEKHDECLLVFFRETLNYSSIKCLIHDELVMPEFSRMNDIWLIGKHRADLRLREIQALLDDICQLVPAGVRTGKIAIVVDPGLTSAILELLAAGLERRLSLSCRTFETFEAAEEWIGRSASQVA